MNLGLLLFEPGTMMKHPEHTITALFLCAIFCLISSCESGGIEPVHLRSPRHTSSNLNMKGKPLRASSAQEIVRIQTELEYLGYDPGPVRGCCTPQTRQAIKRFQVEHNLVADGAPGPMTEYSIRKAIRARAAIQNSLPKSLESNSVSTQ